MLSASLTEKHHHFSVGTKTDPDRGSTYQNTVQNLLVQNADTGIYLGPIVNGNQITNVDMYQIGQFAVSTNVPCHPSLDALADAAVAPNSIMPCGTLRTASRAASWETGGAAT